MPAVEESGSDRRRLSISTAILSIGVLIALLYYGRLFLVTLVASVIIAFILDPAVGFFERLHLNRGLASFVVCSIAVLMLYLAGLGLYTQVEGLVDELPKYSQRITDMVDRTAKWYDSLEQRVVDAVVPKRMLDRGEEARPQAPPPQPTKRGRRQQTIQQLPPVEPAVQEVRIRPSGRPLLNFFYTYIAPFYDAMIMASFIPFLVYFMLSWRDHVRSHYQRLFARRSDDTALRAWDAIATVARAYVVGNFMLGVLLSVLSALFFWWLQLPYWQLVGPLSGFLSLIPYIGLPLAMLPPIFAALPIYDRVGAYLVIGTTVAFFHLIALNLFYPKVVGSRVHLNPLVVTIALMFWTAVWGGIGLLLAIPVTAAVKAVFDNVEGFETWGRLMGDSDQVERAPKPEPVEEPQPQS